MTLFQTQVAGFTAVVLAALALMALERRIPYNAGQRAFRAGFWSDLLLYNLFQSYVLGAVIGALLAWMDARLGWSRLGLLSGWPVVAQLLLFLVTHDAYIYAFHRAMHSCPLLWRIHEAHHSATDVDWLSGVRSHALEILINQTVEFAPIVLLGAAPAVAVWKGVVSAIWGMFIHSNLDVGMGPLQRVLNGPEMHRWHHSIESEADRRNFATKLAIWDWAFGTAYLPDPSARKASRYGLAGGGFPDGYLRQQLHAFGRSTDAPARRQPAPEAA
jgi:sterol desaturase/sphingolipid hydroxylase (fatty acid hydroxylase superfamily)